MNVGSHWRSNQPNLKSKNEEKFKTTARLTQRDVFLKNNISTGQTSLLQVKMLLSLKKKKLKKMRLQYYIVVNVVIHISKSKGVAEMTNKTNKIN